MKFKIDPKFKTVCIMLLVWSLVHLCWYIANHARPYGSMEGANWGIAWDMGGYEFKGNPGLFVCNGHEGNVVLQQALPQFTTEC